MFQLSKAVRQLFYANITIFVAGILLQLVSFPFYETFALYPQEGFMLHQLITHQFLHGGFLHILFNMLVLVSIAPTVEDYLGYNKFILYYILCGLGSAFFHMFMISSAIPLVGASGAIYGIMLIFTILNPDQKLYFFGLIGLKSKYLVSLLFISEIYLGFASQGDGIGHLCHVGGGLTGMILIFIDKVISKTKKKRWS